MFGHAAGGTNKQENLIKNTKFLMRGVIVVFMFSCVVWLPGRGAGGRVNLENQ